MATERANADQTMHTQTYSNVENSTERGESTKFHFSKALAHRAVYGSSSRRGTGSRKVRNNDARILPSRLSKVSLADDDSQN
ncbi:hypothetical protein REPUB_Repub12eG0147400 [Reevesia pubescens]